MKILLLNDYATDAGGAEIQMQGLRSDLRTRGHDARLFASVAGRAAHPSSADWSPDFECFGTTSRLRTLLQTANPYASRRLRAVLDEFQPDLVHIMMFLT